MNIKFVFHDLRDKRHRSISAKNYLQLPRKGEMVKDIGNFYEVTEVINDISKNSIIIVCSWKELLFANIEK